MTIRLHGLVAATHTPFDADGRVNLAAVEAQAAHMLGGGVAAVFINGSTGECHSLTVAERLALAERWIAVTRQSPLRVIVHVGSNCLADAAVLAAHAQQHGAAAVAAQAPSYFKPATVAALIECCRGIAAAAPGLPFYYYDIPVMTGIHVSVPDFLDAAADHIPNLAGAKFSNPDLMAYQRCLHCRDGRFDIPWGLDEYLLAALAVGGQGGVGSSYNFASPLYVRLIEAFQRGDLAAAREEQFRSVQLIHLLAEYGYMAASKALMAMLGVPVGPPRPPLMKLAAEKVDELRAALTAIGLFDWPGICR